MPYCRLFYHFIWATKKRLPLILPVFEQDLYRAVCSKVVALDGIVHSIGGTEDHIHLAVTIPPKQTLTKFIGKVKGTSSHYVNHIIKPDFEFYWQTEYGVLTFSEKNLTTIVRYIHLQKLHHKDGTIINAMELT